MYTDGPVGFWSYAHDDNKLDDGGILRLAKTIAEEYELLAGEPLQLFVDRDIVWGEMWRRRIDSALVQTTFFIPVVTPRYFRRPECRRELLEFAAKATSLGVLELLLPIVYVKPQNFSEDNSDEAIALVAKAQYVDWQRLRLREPRSRRLRDAVNRLSQRLIDIGDLVAESQFAREMNQDLDVDSPAGVIELTQHIMELLPEWLDAVMGDRVYQVQVDVTWHQCIAQVNKLRRAHAPASAITAAQIRAAKEMLPLLERHLQDAEVYLTRSVELDPYISALARLISEHPESFELARSVRDSIDEAMANIARQYPPLNKSDHTIGDHFEEWKHLGRIFQKCIATANRVPLKVHEGNAIVKRWDDEFRRPVTMRAIE